MTTFIHLPHKSTEYFDWTNTLRKFLTSTFGRSFTEEISPPIEQLDKLRADIEHTTYKDGESIIPLYLNYIAQLNSLGLRLPMELVLSHPFKWSDAFASKSVLFEQKSLSFEKASVLFNLASIYSYLGAVASASMDWKMAVNYFTSAAGVLQFVALHFLHAPTDDLKVESTKGFASLMIAQAQECFLWNYMQSENVKNSLSARLAEGTSLSYRKAAEYMSNADIELDFEKEIEFKTAYFGSFALFQYAKSYMDSTNVGFAIAVNQMVKQSVAEGKKLYVQFKNNIEQGLHRLLLSIESESDAKAKEWERDNDLIYHNSIPDKSNIPTIKAMDGVKAKDFETMVSTLAPADMFSKIVPMEAHQGMSIYSEKQAEIVRKYNESVSVANEQVKSLFEFSNLPASIIDIQNLLKPTNAVAEEEEREKQQEYPRVLAIAYEVQNSLNVDFLNATEAINQKRDFIIKKLNSVEEDFTRDDKIMLIKGLNENPDLSKLKDEVASVHRVLKEAATSDAKLLDLWNKFETEIKVLCGGAESVQKWLSEPNSESLTQKVSLLDLDDDLGTEADNKSAQELIDTVYSLKRSLELLMAERNSILSDLKTVMHGEDISSVLVKYNGVSEEKLNEVLDELLEKYNIYTSRLDGLINVQDEKILELKDGLSRLLDLTIVKKKLQEKKKNRGTIKNKLTRLINAYETWKLCTKGIGEALAFYTKLCERTTVLTGKVHDIVSLRENDSQTHVNSISTGGFGGYTMNDPQYILPYQSQYQQTPSVPFYPTQTQPPPPSYSNTMNTGTGSAPPIPSKPNTTGSQPYTTPSVYDPNMYSQFGQNWKNQ